MVAYPTRSMLMIVIRHLVFVNNDEILAMLVENGYLYNRICIKPIEILKGNHSNGFNQSLLILVLENL
jgi:hypothetical protein